MRLLAFVCPRTVQNCFVTEAARSPLRTRVKHSRPPWAQRAAAAHTRETRHQLIRSTHARAEAHSSCELGAMPMSPYVVNMVTGVLAGGCASIVLLLRFLAFRRRFLLTFGV